MNVNLTDISSIPKLVKDYLLKNSEVNEFYSLFPTKENILKQAKIKCENYKNRSVLHHELMLQNNQNLSKKQDFNLSQLNKNKTVTITTGHQLNLFTGSIFFHYKIIQTIKLCDELNQEQKEFYFVPIFWMASEDHDFEEINHFYFQSKKYLWNGKNDIPVGRKNITDLKPVLEQFINDIQFLPNANFLTELIQNAYFESETLAQATQKLIQTLYKDLGLIVINADSKNLKKLMTPYFKEELLNQTSFEKIAQTNQKLEKNYKIQVNPREINLFYFTENERIRILFENEMYKIGSLKFTQSEIIQELENFPEKFSPNALLRPFYQEVILPNVAYIGGNAEIAYWLELKSYFESQQVIFPILIPRNSITFLNQKQKETLTKLNLDFFELLNNKEKALKTHILNHSTITINFEKYELQVQKMYAEMILESEKTDSSLKNLLMAQQKRQFNAFEKTKKRILKAEKRRQNEKIIQLEKLYQSIFPRNNWQERTINFSEFYLENPNLLDLIYENIDSIEAKFSLIEL